RDVPGRVHVSVDRQAAGPAPEPRLALSRFRVATPAARAGLRRVRRVDFLDPSGCLVLQAGEVPQGLLLYHLRTCGQPGVLRAGGGKLPALFQVTRRTRAARAPVRVLLDGEVPHEPGMGAVVPQHGLLGGRGEQAVPGHANILATAADISGEVKRRFLFGPKAGVSMPRSR